MDLRRNKMKIITKCVIDMKTSEVIEEESFEYEGPLALCKGGGGGSGAGEVDYPVYMKLTHSDWLNKGDGAAITDTIEKSITEVMDSALGNSPWIGASAYNPDNAIAAYEVAVQGFAGILAGIDVVSSLGNYYEYTKNMIGEPDIIEVDDLVVGDAVVVGDGSIDDIEDITDLAVTDAADITDAEVLLDVAAFANQLDDEILTKVLPRFRRGMQDINAVVSSSFVLGSSIIEGFRDRDVSRYSSTLRINAALKNADIDVANMGKDVRVGEVNMTKDLDIAKANITKDVSLAPINITKDLELSKVNLGKDVEVGTANLKKDVQMSEIRTRTVTEYIRMYIGGADLLIKAASQVVAWDESYARLMVESNRIKIVAKKEENDTNDSINEEDALWDLEVFQYGSNVLAGIAGGTVGSKSKKPSPMSSALGGGLSGAAAGAMIGAQYGTTAGAWYGAAIGAVLGAAIGLMSS